MQIQETKSQHPEPTTTRTTPTLQPWAKPTFQQVPLADALASSQGL